MARARPILPQAQILLAFTRRLAWAAMIGSALGAPGPLAAQDRRQGEPGQFDYYVLVLSWSPSFCANSADRNPGGAARNPQCGRRPFSFVVHGLWPQYERGFPQYCEVPAPRLSRDIVSEMLDLMPAPALIFHEWDRHGVCSGLSPGAYFETIRKARAAVKIPPQYLDLPSPLTVTPQEVEEAFIAANPNLQPEGISVSCGGRRLDEVKICMTRDLQFRGCEEIARRACRRDKLIMPPVRGG
jgi:ribonuclease T2